MIEVFEVKGGSPEEVSARVKEIIEEKQKKEEPETYDELSELVAIAAPEGQVLIALAARCIHETTRAMEMVCGRAKTLPAWDSLSTEDQKKVCSETLELIKDPDVNPEIDHVDWVFQMIQAGWTYGPEETWEGKKHPVLVPYEKLPLPERYRLVLKKMAGFFFRGEMERMVRERSKELEREGPR
jgi:hypothetical protein